MIYSHSAARMHRAFCWSRFSAPESPNSGPSIRLCDCGRYYGVSKRFCPWCGISALFSDIREWNINAVEDALTVLKLGDLAEAEYYDNPVELISGCLRALFIASPGHNLGCSDYSAIEAVVKRAREQWRIDVFRDHGKIYGCQRHNYRHTVSRIS